MPKAVGSGWWMASLLEVTSLLCPMPSQTSSVSPGARGGEEEKKVGQECVKDVKIWIFLQRKIEAESKKIHFVSVTMTLYFVGPVSLGNFVYTICIPNIIKFKVIYYLFLCHSPSYKLPPNYKVHLVR